jgi:hypothetical protein
MPAGSPSEDGRRLLDVLRAAAGELVPHARLLQVLGGRAPRYMEAMGSARATLFVEAWRATGCKSAARAASRRLVCVKRQGYRLAPVKSGGTE